MCSDMIRRIYFTMLKDPYSSISDVGEFGCYLILYEPSEFKTMYIEGPVDLDWQWNGQVILWCHSGLEKSRKYYRHGESISPVEWNKHSCPLTQDQ